LLFSFFGLCNLDSLFRHSALGHSFAASSASPIDKSVSTYFRHHGHHFSKNRVSFINFTHLESSELLSNSSNLRNQAIQLLKNP